MKILAIRGKNLASLNGEFEIDFTNEPLKSAGIFAITGPTGSGKSTLLDALCLALYDSTPRLNKARENNVSLVDVNDKRINQNDTRSILRRGTADGYAEVDFLSVTGKVFRSTWFVRRGRNSITGSLQNVEMRLMNLTTGVEEKGTKTEILASIKKYVGLSFEQFNRSVLLAQGDFAMFLKARQEDKAEILEKLTGTDIYSRISSIIYNKAKDVINEQKNLQGKIDGITLLTDDEIGAFDNEKRDIKVRLESIEKEETRISDSRKWLIDEVQLRAGIKEAEEELLLSVKAVEDAASRFKQLDEIDKVQTIRDTFLEYKKTIKSLKEKEDEQKVCTENYANDLEEVKEASKKVETFKKQLDDYNEEYITLEPQINQARKLDVEIVENESQLVKLKKELSDNQIRIDSNKKHLIDCDNSTKENSEKLDKVNGWFNRYSQFEPLYNVISLVVSVIKNIDITKTQTEKNKEKLVQKGNKQKEKEKILEEKVAEQERLNKLLPSEVVMLRAELTEGTPCPVCGSTHHPIVINVEQSQQMKENELKISKENINKDIEGLKADIDEIKNEITSLNTIIENNKESCDKSKKEISQYVSIIPNWEELLESGQLQGKVLDFQEKWSNKLLQQRSLNEALIKLKSDKEGYNRESVSLKQQQTTCIDDFNKASKKVSDEKDARTHLFNGEKTDDVVRRLNEKKKIIDLNFQKATKSEHSFAIKAEANKTKISQLKNEIDKLKVEKEDNDTSINGWIENNESLLSRERVEELISFDANFIKSERTALTQLTDSRNSRESILKERKRKFDEHIGSENKPSDDKTLESLTTKLNDLKKEASASTERSATINATIRIDSDSRKEKEKLLVELQKKKDVYDNWSALNSLFGSSDGSKFKEIAQGYTLDVLLFYANKHLEDLAPRYELQRIPESLALQIVDLDMMGEIRSVHSLSGGESFLVSLALALGLSSLSSNRMNVESLFIDEGFGSLDIDTLRVAMDALESLQMQGRKIGVISHVEEMTERIAVQVQVIKEGNGVSKVVVNS